MSEQTTPPSGLRLPSRQLIFLGRTRVYARTTGGLGAPLLFTSETHDTPQSTQKHARARIGPPRASPRCFDHIRLGTGSGGILMSFRTYNTHKSPRARREVFLYRSKSTHSLIKHKPPPPETACTISNYSTAPSTAITTACPF